MGPMSIDTSTPGLSLHGFPGAMCGGYVMRPESQGSILIGGLDSATPAIIDPNYLATDYDRRVSVALFRFIRAMFTQPALRSDEHTSELQSLMPISIAVFYLTK